MHNGLPRRTFLAASAAACMGLPGSTPALAGSAPARTRRAKSTILFFLCGGASHIDTWDMKPQAPVEYRGEFEALPTSAPGVSLCEHLPLTAQQAHHLAVVQGVTDGGLATGDHHAGYYYNLTGHAPDTTFRTQGNDRRPQADDWPFIGSVVGSRRPPHRSLPQVITLPYMPSRAPYTRPGQFAARLGVEHDPFYLMGDHAQPLEFASPSLSLSEGLTPGRLDNRRALLQAFDNAQRNFVGAGMSQLGKQQQKAFTLLQSPATANAFDLTQEPAALRARYGETLNGMSLLMARRLVEAEVPFVTVFWRVDDRLRSKCRSGGGWDTHGNNFQCLKENLLPEFDQGYSALLEDLNQRGMLDETLVMVTSEMGRKPLVGDRRSGGVTGAGRDHWTRCMSVLLAGGGIQGGQVFGETDAKAEGPLHRPVSPADVAHTVYHAMGINDLMIEDSLGRPISLLETGQPLTQLF
ncbi:DUF1501 domain-containing protein [Lignipirellula cremea]|uniref:Sulfatase n=1 Tax=Lignipirellula cremea TaxID=2528010 RepID=A0A518DNQ4_9BACT|nr:DUF1501 domain-containing protein [Lignipirellula cremea]QDU93469.1 hypothetical protein Pla8534_12490 [Lignipirellula cremea]